MDQPPATSPPPRQQIDRRSPMPFYRQLLDLLLKEKWRTGERFPSENQLCERYGVSRSVVRQTLGHLAADGAIHKVKGQGVFYAEPKIGSGFVQEAVGFYEEMTRKGHLVQTEILQAILEGADVAVASRLATRVHEPIVRLDRRRFVDGEIYQFVRNFLPARFCPGLERIDLTDRSLYQLLRENYHVHPATGERTIEAIALNNSEAVWLQASPGASALKIESVTRNQAGEIFEYFIGWYRGDKAKLQVRLG